MLQNVKEKVHSRYSNVIPMSLELLASLVARLCLHGQGLSCGLCDVTAFSCMHIRL